MKTLPNDPAYPISEEETDRIDSGVKIYTGLTKREHFAGLAMQGICSHPDTWGKDSFEKIAIASIEMADALIEELNKTEK